MEDGFIHNEQGLADLPYKLSWPPAKQKNLANLAGKTQNLANLADINSNLANLADTGDIIYINILQSCLLNSLKTKPVKCC